MDVRDIENSRSTITPRKFAALIALTITLFALLIVGVNQYGDLQITFSLSLFLIGGSIYALSLTIRGIRYYLLLQLNMEGELSKNVFVSSIGGVYLGWGINVFVPGRLGEISRILLLSNEQISREKSFNSIIIEKIFDFLMMSLIGIVSFGFIFFGQSITPEIREITILMVVLLFISILGLLLLTKTHNLIPILSKIPKIGSRLGKLTQILSEQIESLRQSPTKFFTIFGLSIFIWSLDILVFLIVLSTILQVPIETAVFSVVSGFLSFIFPILPNATGQFEAIVGGIFVLFGLPFISGFQAALLDHVIKAVTAVLLGSLTIIFSGVKLLNLFESDMDDSSRTGDTETSVDIKS